MRVTTAREECVRRCVMPAYYGTVIYIEAVCRTYGRVAGVVWCVGAAVLCCLAVVGAIILTIRLFSF